MQHDYVFAGFGGQGVMFAGQLLAYAAMDEGLQVTWIPSYGPEMRGGTANCSVVISDRLIGSPAVSRPQHAIVFNNPSFDKYVDRIAVGGLLLINSSLVTKQAIREDIMTLYVPATDLADQVGDLKLANMVLMGALITASPVMTLEAVKRALDVHSSKRDKLPLNLKALDAGAQAVVAAHREGCLAW
jgi:2-oxoglutarate ferredoxin oxidoreductase subunit gamma